MSPDYNAARDNLATQVDDIPGVISVGIGKKNNKIVLVIATNNDFSKDGKAKIPGSFNGIDVVYRKLGDMKLYSTRRN